MSEKIIDTNKNFCAEVIDVLAAKGVKEVVCSPGSRNAPLLIACAARNNLKKHVVIDERSAAFFALGIAAVSQRPVALICTSGTALLNYGPAIAEAYYQGVPLIIISADRPEQWIDQDDSQTLRQFEALANYVKKSYQIPAYGNDDPEMLWYSNRIANDAMIEALSRRRGPVHINMQFGNPLSGKISRDVAEPRVIDLITCNNVWNTQQVVTFARKVAKSKVMVVAGFMPPSDKLNQALSAFCSLPNVAVMIETISNLHLTSYSTDIDSALTGVDEKTLDELAPDLVISVGGSLVSRKLKEYLRRNRNHLQHWSVGFNHTTSDCFMSLSKRIEVEPSSFFNYLTRMMNRIKLSTNISSFKEDWETLKKHTSEVKMKYVEEAPWTELYAFNNIFNLLPKSSNLFLSNGTAVRYAQLLRESLPHAAYCNRGVSGIDGSVSTAFGGAMCYRGGFTVIITGDMSMSYDVGSLALPGIPDSVRLIVIDNSGGGIFRFIPTTSSLPEREKFFCCRPLLPLRQLAEGYGWEYYEALSDDGFSNILLRFFRKGKKKILRVVCDGEKSAEILKNYMNQKI